MSENLISVYTRQNAIDDGIFVDVSEVAKLHGFLIPVAITTNLFNTHIKKDQEDRTQNNLNLFLKELRQKLQKQQLNSLLYLQFNFYGSDHVDVWIAIEAQSPTDPSMAMNCMLPEDH